jgi:lysophospholipid acyltransferase (LPLAT)-like uncharacterized protein
MKVIAYLMYAGYAVLSVVRDGNRAVFIFEDSDERRATVLAFWNKQQRVEPVAFISCQNKARDMIAEALRPKED